jgi:hypothetical protein
MLEQRTSQSCRVTIEQGAIPPTILYTTACGALLLLWSWEDQSNIHDYLLMSKFLRLDVVTGWESGCYDDLVVEETLLLNAMMATCVHTTVSLRWRAMVVVLIKGSKSSNGKLQARG